MRPTYSDTTLAAQVEIEVYDLVDIVADSSTPLLTLLDEELDKADEARELVQENQPTRDKFLYTYNFPQWCSVQLSCCCLQ